MGRDCGYLAMASAVALAADAVLVRELGKSEEQLVADVAQVVRHGFARGKRRILVIKSEGIAVPCTRLVRLVEPLLPGVEVRATVLGHVLRGGNPSYHDRAIAGRLGFGATAALLEGATDEMVGWLPPVPEGGVSTHDASVTRFSLERVLQETQSLIDGSSPVTQRRLQLMERAHAVLSL